MKLSILPSGLLGRLYLFGPTVVLIPSYGVFVCFLASWLLFRS